MITYSIRKARNDDIADIAEIQKGVVEHNFIPFMGKEKADEYFMIKDFEKYLKQNIENTSLLFNKTDLIAFSIWNDDRLMYLSVTPEHQNTIAALYFLKSLCYDKFLEYKEVFAECLEKNERANRFFEKFGWKRCGEKIENDPVFNRIKYSLRVTNREQLMEEYK